MTLVSLPGGEDWLLRPVARGWLRAESLQDGSVDLCFLGLLNDAISVHDENERRMIEAASKR